MKGTSVFVLILLSILVSTITGLVSLSPAYACTFTATLSPSTIGPGTSFYVSGVDTCDPTDCPSCSPPYAQVEILIFTGSCPLTGIPSGTQVDSGESTLFENSGTSANLSDRSYNIGPFIFTTTLSPGSYCVHVFTEAGGQTTSTPSVNAPLTVIPFQNYTFSLTSTTSTLPPVITTTQTLPPASIVETDWAVLSVSMNPPAPTVGQTVIFSMIMTAVWSSGSFPQTFNARCVIDGANCGRGQVTYPGPIGTPIPVNANRHPWQATPGTHTLTWMISTDNDPNPSNNVMSITFTVGQTTTQPANSTQPVPDFTINTNPSAQTVLQGQTVSYSVNVTALNGFNSPVSLSVSGLPSGANGVFSTPSATPNFASTLTVTLPDNVSTGSYTLTVTGSGGGLSNIANLVLTVNAMQTSSTLNSQTSSDLMSMIQQNQILILGGIVLLAAVIIAVALRGQRKTTQPAQPTSSATPGTLYCRKCGTQNSNAHEFCTKCGNKLG